MSVFLSPVGGAGAQFFDNNGNPLTGGKLYTYAAGTTTPQATYTSAAGSTFHTNPIVLDAAGRVPGSSEIWLADNQIYKFVLKDSNDVLLATWDQITGVNSNFVNYTTETEVQTATAGQTVFTLTTMSYAPGTGGLTVYVDGVNQYEGDSYVETNSTTVTFTAGLHVGALVKFTTAVQTTGNATDASVVTYTAPYTGAIQYTVESKLAQYVSVKDFGAVGDGVTDDTAAIQAAIDGIEPGATLFFPAGDYVVSNLTVQKPITILGDGQAAMASANPSSPSFGAYLSGTRIKAKAAATGYLFNVSPGAIVNAEGKLYGVEFKNIYLFGNNRTSSIGGIKVESTDHSVFEDVTAESFQREAILLNAAVRESSFTRIHTRFCGTRNTSGTSYATLGIVETSLADPHNFLHFIDCFFVYSLGDTVFIDHTNGAATREIHDIYFTNCLFHGTLYFIQGVPYTITPDMQATVLLHNKGGRDVVAQDCNFLFAGDNKPHVMSATATAGGFLPITQINSSTLVNHYSLTSLGYSIEALSGTILADQNRFQTSLSGSIKVYSGASYLIGQNWIGSGTTAPVFDSGSTDLNNVITFTPTFVASSGGTPVYATQQGRATRNGNVMTFTARIVLSSKGSLNGILQIAGLPFAIRSPGLSTVSFYFTGANAAVVNIVGRVETATPRDVKLFKIASGNASGLGTTDITDSFEIVVSGSYMVESN